MYYVSLLRVTNANMNRGQHLETEVWAQMQGGVSPLFQQVTHRSNEWKWVTTMTLTHKETNLKIKGAKPKG